MSDSADFNQNRWHRLESLYEEALTMATSQRPQFVINSCGDDNMLRDQLLSLLMQKQPDESRATVANASAATLLDPGHIIDRYRIVRQLGAGGMGVVYLAERADSDFEQKVAIKLVSSNLISPNVVARLRGERQILATLNHPNIARLIDGGATAEGIPYLVMEYVEGTRIDLYCSTHQLDIRARLKLFQQVCAAVNAAHQQLIIHRDIKPSNILVTEAGIPKLLDFGIAKLLDADLRNNDSTVLTLFNERMMTPEYASPEQIRGEPLSTASDVYALGVLLYELLTGFKPYRFKGGTLSQLEQLIQNHNPAKPSIALAQALNSGITGIDATLTRTLRGDLDTIVMKALHKDIPRRYGSASALAEDIDNYLANRPISARPDNLGYIAKKFWQRNRWVVSSVLIALLVVIGLSVFYTLRITAERDIAQREKLTATRVSQFMTDVFRVANPNESKANSVPVREVLDNAAARIDTELKNEPQVQIVLLRKMAQAYMGIGSWNSAETLLTHAVALQRSAFSSHSLELAGILTALADVQHRKSKFSEEASSLEEALAIRHSLRADHDRDTVIALVALANNVSNSGKVDSARQYLREAETIANAWPIHDNYILGKIYSGYGDAFSYISRYQEAETYYRKALPLLHGTIEQGADLYADNVLSLAGVLIDQSQLDEAKTLLSQLISELGKLYDSNHPIIGSAWNELGIAHCESGEYQQCSDAFQKSIDIEQTQNTGGSKRLAMMYNNLGSAYRDAGNIPAALNALATGIPLMRHVSSNHDPVLMSMYYEQSGALRESGKLNEAEKSIAAGEAVAAHYSGQGYVGAYFVMLERGRMLIARHAYATAITHLEKTLKQTPPEERRLRASIQLALGQALLATHRCDDAIRAMTSAYETRHTAMPKQNWFIYEAENNLGNALSVCGHNKEAEPMLNDSVEQLQQLRNKDDLQLAEAERNLLAFQKRNGKNKAM